MNPKKKNFLLIFIVMIINLGLIPLVIVRGSDYDLGVDKESIIIWSVNLVNDKKIDEFLEYTFDYDEYDYDFEEGDKFKAEITSITKYKGYYYVNFKYYEGKKLDYSDYQDEYTEKVAKDPEDLAEGLYEGVDFSCSIMFICIDPEDFLAEFNEYIPIPDRSRVYAKESTIFINRTVDSYPYWMAIKFDENGIQKKFSLYNNDILILETELKEISHNRENIVLIIFLIGVIIAAIIINILIDIFIVIKISKKPKDIQEDKSQSSEKMFQTGEIPKEKVEDEKIEEKADIKYCEKCGGVRDIKTKFCPYCGIKY